MQVASSVQQAGMRSRSDEYISARSSVSSVASIKPSNSSVETTVTKLLISTKHLLQTLTQWSKGLVTEKIVSDAYVQLGNDLKVVSKFFKHLGVDVSDLANVPMNLRKVLEGALRETPSEDTLNKYLPTIREIIVTLLDKLKVKQTQLKTIKQEKSQQLHKKSSSVVSNMSSLSISSTTASSETPSIFTTAQSSDDNRNENLNDSPADHVSTSHTDETLNTEPDQNNYHNDTDKMIINKNRTLSETDALLQLKNGSNLQRRASKRFSAYQFAKLTNQSTAGASSTAVPAYTTTSTDEYEINNVGESALSKLSSTEVGSNVATAGSNISSDDQCILFLKLGEKTKKCQVLLPSNINELRLLFLKEFAFSPRENDFPDVYIRDQQSSVFYELDQQNFSDLRDGAILELHLEENTIVKSDIAEVIKIMKLEISKSQDDILGKIKSLNITAQPTLPIENNNVRVEKIPIAQSVIRNLKYELSVLRQLRNDENKNFKSTIATLLEKVETFKSQTFESTTSSNRTYIEKSQTSLGDVSDSLLSRVDDIQDIIEVLRKDVAVRGAKPTTKKLESVLKELNDAESDLSKMQAFISAEKPNWKKIWETELDKVCEEQQFLSLQEDLALDLREDLNKASETFDLVKLCCEEQEKNPKKIKSNPVLPIPKPGTLNNVRNQLLVEVQSLTPDHEGRVGALERAQKLWQKERSYKDNDEFEDELGNFVENANFKRSGGIEEVERLRKQKDEENLRSNFSGF